MSEETYANYTTLIQTVKEEQTKGITNSFNQQLLKAIDRTIERLKTNPQYGVPVTRKTAGDTPFKHYGVDRLYLVDLTGYWRLVYTLSSTEIKIVSLILDYIDHDRYNKIFGYKKR
jgi:hypothetical protein